MNKSKVSILCLTYNHEKFIKKALDSFFMQKTNFDFEIIIHDDASTDKTVKIIKTYQKKYPGIIKTILQKENQYSQFKRDFVVKYLLPSAQGKYISLCEGDDFFTDENKLQMQVDFLDKNPDYSICFHPINVFFENKEEKNHIWPIIEDKSRINTKELLKNNFIPTNSVVYRKQKSYKNVPTNIFPGDWFLHLYHAQFGKIGFINKVMSSYRRHSNGIYWDSYVDPDQLIKKFGINQLRFYFEQLKLYGKKNEFKTTLLTHINNILNKFIKIDQKDKKIKLLEGSFKTFPSSLAKYFININLSKTHEQLIALQSESELQKSEITHLQLEISNLKNELDFSTTELIIANAKLNAIVNSLKWRIAVKIDNLIPNSIKNILILIKSIILKNKTNNTK